MPSTTSPRAATRVLALLATLVGLLAAVLTSVPASAAAVIDGKTQTTAAASCWEIKQNDPAAVSGSYWLLTPQLEVPRTFYCDMTTDGGGWVLVGRGRNGWKDNYNGLGTSDQVAATVTGTGAFAVKQLDARVIDGLLGGRRVDSMTDGVRLRRALDAAGTNFQESSFRFKSRDRWSWSFGAGFPIASGTIGSASIANTSTRNFATDDSWQRVWTYDDKANGYVRGFNYGSGATGGSTSASSYLYSSASGGRYPTPFTQVFLRPKLRTSDLTYSSIPTSGTTVQERPAIPESGSMPSTWGVTGTGAGGTGENASEVQAFAQIGNVMYVGGNFTTVQKGSAATGANKISQPYLAAFDATTGAYLSSFNPPTLNNQVKSLAALPNGRLAVGGEFTTVGGTSRPGLVVLTSTGAVDTAWSTTILNKMTGGTVSIRGLDVSGDYLYLGGAMTHIKAGTTETYAKGAGRIRISTRTADPAWNPEFNGTVTALDVSDDGSRAYFSGYFTLSRSEPALRGAAFSTASGAARITPAWTPTFSTGGSARYQQAVKQVGSRVWLGGSQHSMFGYNTSTFALEKTNITKWGGDMQAIDGGNGLVFGGCHCEHWNLSGTSSYDGASPGQSTVAWSQADKIYYIGAWDAGTGDYVADFTPEMRARGGYGVWAIKVASDGTVWAGGSLQNGVSSTGSNQWLGGFARFAQRDHTAPSAPSAPAATLADSAATVSWRASSTGGVTYEVLRNDRVVATTQATSVVVPDSAETDQFFVRAADAAGNRSASTAAFSVPADAGTTTELVPAASTWSYQFSATAPPTTWSTSATGTEAWASGPAPLGWGTGPITTNIDVPAGQTRPLTSYFRRTFSVADPAALQTLTLTTRADDGIAVYINGVEVARSNLPTGSLTPGTYALSAPNTATATANPVVVQVPVSVLTSGTNTIAVEVHSNYKATPSSSMDLSLVGSS